MNFFFGSLLPNRYLDLPSALVNLLRLAHREFLPSLGKVFSFSRLPTFHKYLQGNHSMHQPNKVGFVIAGFPAANLNTYFGSVDFVEFGFY